MFPVKHIQFSGGAEMRILRFGSTGPAVQLLQLALNRAGYGFLQTDGIFGVSTRAAVTRFQSAFGLSADGVVGSMTHRAILPWYTGYLIHTISPGSTIYSIARQYQSSVDAILTANPQINVLNLRPGAQLVVPLGFDVVPTSIDCFSGLVSYCVRGLAARYPFIRAGDIGKSVMGKPIWSLALGSGQNRVIYNAEHHANEWITVLLLLKFVEDLAKAFSSGGSIYSQSAAEILDYASVFIVPSVNPDGMDLVTGELTQGVYFNSALQISRNYPQFSFPSGWKANIRGIDPNLQYPACWEQARANKFAQGITSPAPADYVGTSPLIAPESRAMYDYTLSLDPSLTLSYHTQGEVIYWRFLDYEPQGSRRITEIFSEVSGYTSEETPYASAFAGYKDWFIQDFNRPGFTIEAGLGTNPLPISQFDEIYRQNLGILTLAALVT